MADYKPPLSPIQRDAQKGPLVTVAIIAAIFAASTLFLAGKMGYYNLSHKSIVTRASDMEKSVAKLAEENKAMAKKIDALNKALFDAKKDKESFNSKIKDAEKRLENLGEEKNYLEEILINKTKELEQVKEMPGASSGDLRALGDRDAEIGRLLRENALLSAKLERLYKTTNEQISEINVAKSVLEQTIAEARQKIEEDWNTVDLGSIQVDSPALSASGREARAPQKGAPKFGGPRKEGRIRAVNEDHGFVVVDLGNVDGVDENSTLYVMKNGKRAAVLSIIEIRDVMAACNVTDALPGYRPAVNDSVLIQK